MVIISLLSNGAVAFSYAWITLSIFRFWGAKREVLPYAWLLLGFCLFIFFCGLTHACDVAVFFWPVYRLFLLIDFTTAMLSLWVAIATPFAVKYLCGWKPPEEVQQLRSQLEHLQWKRARAVAKIRSLRNAKP
jgi:hypothetical protein